MPWADLTLFKYLRSAEPPINADERMALFKEMECVASALDSVHNFEIEKDGIKLALMGCHHDLKPQNILVRGRKFLIADFGLARFKELNQQSETRWKLGTRTYGPPESGSGAKVSRPHDIWSFGCILSEVATFALLGPVGVEEFARRRITDIAPGRSNDYFHDNKAVKLEVLDWLECLNKSAHDGTLISSVTSLARKLLDPNPTTRPRSKFVQAALAQIVEIYKVPDSACILGGKAHLQTVMEVDRNKNISASAGTRCESLSHSEEQREDYRTAGLGALRNSSRLLNAKKNPYFEDATWPMIHIAAIKGEKETVHRILTLEHPHASIATNDDGNTVLHIAAEYGQVDVMEKILAFTSSHSLLPSIALRKNASGKTALHLAAENGKKECAVKLRQSMSDVNHVRDLLEEKDDFGNTPMDLAQQNGHNFMLGCLSSAAFCC
jgi:serine/threonine protein kinase